MVEVRCRAYDADYFAYIYVRHLGNDNATFMPPEI